MAPPPDRKANLRNRDDEDEGGDEEQRSFLSSLLGALRDWTGANRMRAIISAGLLVFSGLLGLGAVCWHIANIRNRPTLQDAVYSLDYGGFLQARLQAATVLRYTGSKDYETRGGALYVMGVATCLSADLSTADDRTAAYLSAANYLQESLDNGFLSGRQQEGYFYLGKSLYRAGELKRCRGPLISALELGAEDHKTALWYLANASFYDSEPNFDDALRYTTLFRKWPTTTPNEASEGDLLECLILLQKGELDLARKIYATVPDLEQFHPVRHFIAGRILMEEARRLTADANELERLPDPTAAFRKLESLQSEQTGPPQLEEPPRQRPIRDTNSPHEKPHTETAESDDSARGDHAGSYDETDTNTEDISPPKFPAESPVSLPLPSKPQPPSILPPTGMRHPEQRTDVVLAVWDETRETPELIRRVALMQRRLPGTASGESPLLQRREQGAGNREQRTEKEPGSTVPSDGRQEGEQEAGNQEQDAEKTPEPVGPEPANDDQVTILPDEEPASPFPPRRPEQSGTATTLDKTPASGPGEAVEALPDEEQLRLKIRELRNRAIQKYEQAIAAFHEATVFDDMPLRWTRQATLLQGGCYEELAELRPADDLLRARECYQELIGAFPDSFEAVAASFLLAEILQRRGQTEAALGAYRQAFDKLRANPGYTDNFLTKAAIFERAANLFSRLIAQEEFEQAFTMLAMLRPVMPEERTLRMGAFALNRWAEMLRRKADAARFESRDALVKQAEEKYRAAGAWFADLARYRFAETDYGTCLWNSAENFRAGRDYRKSIYMFRKYLGVNLDRQQAEVKYALGEMYFELDLLDEAVAVLKQGMEDHPRSVLIPWMRLVLSKAYHEQRKWNDAELLLRQNLNGEFAPESAIFRDSLYALGRLRFDAGDDDRAITDLDDALTRHPRAPQAPEAHYLIARSHLNKIQVAEKAIREAVLQRTKNQLALDVQSARERVIEHYRRCEALLRDRENVTNLTQAERLMLRNLIFGIGTESMHLKRFDDAIFAYDLAATQYQNSADALTALMQTALAYRQLAAGAQRRAAEATSQGNAALAETETREMRRTTREAIAAINRAKILRETLQNAGAFQPGVRFTATEWSEILRVQEELTKQLFE